jgi:hypothetical protein
MSEGFLFTGLQAEVDATIPSVPFQCPDFEYFYDCLAASKSVFYNSLEMVGTAGFEPTTSTV